jgi:DUF1365 family protein
MRTWGWLFNPISLYFCFGGGDDVDALVAEVQNTPWHERCAYVAGPPGEHRFAKMMHVSPFLPMDVDYRLRYGRPDETLSVRIEVVRGDLVLFTASLLLRRRRLDRKALAALVWHPQRTYAVSTRIYAQAARLRRRGAPFYGHPGPAPVGSRREDATSSTDWSDDR